MQVGDHLGVLEVLLIVLQEHLSGVLVQCALGEGHDEQTFYDFEDVVEGPGCWVPVLLEGVHADLSFFGDVGMEYFGDEVA